MRAYANCVQQYHATDFHPDEMDIFLAGASKRVVVNAYERDPKARDECIRAFGAIGHVCDMDFEQTYGDIGKGFIHVHHKTLLSSIGNDYIVNPKEDLVPVCPNCHAMLHKRNPPYSVDELKGLISPVMEERTESPLLMEQAR